MNELKIIKNYHDGTMLVVQYDENGYKCGEWLVKDTWTPETHTENIIEVY